MVELASIEQLIETLKAQKVEHFKSEGIEIKFSMLSFLPEPKESPSSKTQTHDEDELLYYSAPERR